jgi:hypothetical protein
VLPLRGAELERRDLDRRRPPLGGGAAQDRLQRRVRLAPDGVGLDRLPAARQRRRDRREPRGMLELLQAAHVDLAHLGRERVTRHLLQHVRGVLAARSDATERATARLGEVAVAARRRQRAPQRVEREVHVLDRERRRRGAPRPRIAQRLQHDAEPERRDDAQVVAVRVGERLAEQVDRAPDERRVAAPARELGRRRERRFPQRRARTGVRQQQRHGAEARVVADDRQRAHAVAARRRVGGGRERRLDRARDRRVGLVADAAAQRRQVLGARHRRIASPEAREQQRDDGGVARRLGRQRAHAASSSRSASPPSGAPTWTRTRPRSAARDRPRGRRRGGGLAQPLERDAADFRRLLVERRAASPPTLRAAAPPAARRSSRALRGEVGGARAQRLVESCSRLRPGRRSTSAATPRVGAGAGPRSARRADAVGRVAGRRRAFEPGDPAARRTRVGRASAVAAPHRSATSAAGSASACATSATNSAAARSRASRGSRARRATAPSGPASHAGRARRGRRAGARERLERGDCAAVDVGRRSRRRSSATAFALSNRAAASARAPVSESAARQILRASATGRLLRRRGRSARVPVAGGDSCGAASHATPTSPSART